MKDNPSHVKLRATQPRYKALRIIASLDAFHRRRGLLRCKALRFSNAVNTILQNVYVEALA